MNVLFCGVFILFFHVQHLLLPNILFKYLFVINIPVYVLENFLKGILGNPTNINDFLFIKSGTQICIDYEILICGLFH